MIKIQERQTVKCPGVTSLFISFNYNKYVVDEIKLLTDRYYDSNTNEWEVPLTSLSEVIDRCCVYDDITIIPAENKSVEHKKYELLNYKTKPFDYQEEGIQFGLNMDKWLLLDAPGLGKTLQLTYLASELKNRYNVEHCLIICGINTLKMNWKTEIEKHSDLSCRILGQRTTRRGKLVIDGVSKRLEQLKAPIEEFFVITNIETLREDKIVKEILKGKANKFDMIVVDEIHTCKNNSSSQGANLLKLTKAKFRIGATGTVLMNSPFDTFVPLKWIGAERANFSNFKHYYGKYGGTFGSDLIGFQHLEILKNQIEQYSLRRTKDILNLPPKTIINEYVEMSSNQEEFYKNITDGIIDQVDKVHMSTANLLAMVARLRQATVLPSILTTENISSAKLDRAQDLVEQLISNGEKVVVFSTFKQPVYELAKRLQYSNLVIGTGDQKEIEIEMAKKQFQEDPNIKVFIGTWQKCGTGITLTSASYMIFLDVPWTDSNYTQAQDRIYRIGTSKSVTIYHLITRDTIDERVLEIVNDKGAIADYVIDDEITESGIASLRKYIADLN